MKCDICQTEITSVYVDGKTVYGPWANMCLYCHATKGVGLGLGLGKGQAYDVETNTQLSLSQYRRISLQKGRLK